MNREAVHTLADLRHWDRTAPSLAVLGHPVGHSLSPNMHMAALAELASADPVFADWRYFKFDVPPDQLGEALPVFRARGFLGLNLTIPHKIMAVDLVRRIDPEAATSGAVNTLRRWNEGYEGFNTDGYGICRAVSDAFRIEIPGTPVVLLGAGGAARAAANAFLVQRCGELWIGNRTPSRLDTLLATLTPTAKEHTIALHGFAFDQPPADLPENVLVINATSSGLKPDDSAPVDLKGFPRTTCVYDMIYNPPETPLMRQAAALGMRTANGLSMLAHQGARSLELWTGRTVSADTMLHACLSALATR